MTTASAAWAGIEAEGVSRTGVVRRRVYPSAAPDIYAGIDSGARVRLFQLEVDRAAAPEPSDLIVTSGFVMEITAGARPDRSCVTVRAVDRALGDVFTVLAEDVLSVTARAGSQPLALAAFFDRLRIWQFLFAKGAAEALTVFERRGLFGELLFLEKLFPIMGCSRAVAAWVGPFGRDRDFQSPSWTVEVKATTRKPPYRVIISNVRQLDPGDGAKAILAAFVIDENSGSGAVSLPELVERARQHISAYGESATLLDLDGRLIASGYLDSHAPVYTERFALRDTLFFNVEAGFPRILEASVPNGVGDVRYSVTLDACEAFRFDESELPSRCG